MCKSRCPPLFSIYELLTEDLGTGSSNNYAYLVVDDKSKDAVIIDPANPDEYVQTIRIGRDYNAEYAWQSCTGFKRTDKCWEDQSDGDCQYASVCFAMSYLP